MKQAISWGLEVESHTITHRGLTKLWLAELRYELVGSGNVVRRLLAVPVDFFCFTSSLRPVAHRRGLG